MANRQVSRDGRNEDEETPLLHSSGEQEQSEDDKEWDNDETNNPRNWKRWYKWVLVVLVSFIEFLTTMPNFMYAPNITDAEKDLNTNDDTLATFSLTIYVLGFGLGPLLFAPLSELYGRTPVYRQCMIAYIAMTIGCGLSQNIEMLVAFRFLAGGFGAAPVAIGGAVVGDLFATEERGTAMSIYQAGLIIAAVNWGIATPRLIVVVVGPPIGGLIGSYLQWRWVFWIVVILAGFASICTFVILRETHAPTLRRKIYGDDGMKSNRSGNEEKQSLASALRQALMRPIRMLVRSPAVASGCLLIFIVIGLLNVFLTELSRTVQEIYDISAGQSGLMYLGLALGFVAASVIFGLTNDRIMHALTKRYGGDTQPEYRLPPTIAALPISVAGTLLYGWTLQYRKRWIIPIVGSGLAGLGITTVQLSITTYMVDSFDTFSASALAAVTMARSIGGAVVPLAAPPLYAALDQGWGNTVFAGIGAACSIIPMLMYKYGPGWRAMFSSEDMM